MIPSPARLRRASRYALPLALLLACGGCDEEVVVRVSTKVWPQGGFGRRVEIAGRDEQGAAPKEQSWLASRVGVRLANRDAWSSVEETPGRIVAEGFFPRAEDIPPTLSHRTGATTVADHAKATLRVDDLLVLHRWMYREILSDPYGKSETAAALDALVSIATEYLRDQVGQDFGDDANLAAGEKFLKEDARTLLEELLPILRQGKTATGLTPDSRKQWTAVLSRHGIPIDAASEGPFSGRQAELVSGWMRAKMAQALSTTENPLKADDLLFWPGEESEVPGGPNKPWAAEEDLASRIEPLLPALAGYYGDVGGPRFRFEARLSVPGRILRTNGTQDGDGVLWLFRDEDLLQGERVLDTESVEVNDDALKSLGARRDLDAASLVEITDLLTDRDPQGSLRKILADAVQHGQLKLLRDPKIPAELQTLARELADLLDPAVEREPPSR